MSASGPSGPLVSGMWNLVLLKIVSFILIMHELSIIYLIYASKFEVFQTVVSMSHVCPIYLNTSVTNEKFHFIRITDRVGWKIIK